MIVFERTSVFRTPCVYFAISMEGYSSVWQCWDLVQSTHTSEKETTHLQNKNMSRSSNSTSMRQEVQRARIAKRLPISSLASLIKCDVAILAAFERGDDILPDDVQQRLLKQLDLNTFKNILD